MSRSARTYSNILSLVYESPLDKHDMKCTLINLFIFYKYVRMYAHGHAQIHAYEHPSTIGGKCLPLRDTLTQTYT